MLLENNIVLEDLEEIYKREINWKRLDGKTILITGAYGMIASYIVFMCIYLNERKGYKINIIAAIKSEEKLRKRFGSYVDKEYFSIYLASIEEPIKISEKIDYIIHAAGLASSQYYYTVPIEVMMPNLLGTIQLLNLAEEKNCESFLLFSSGEIYGKVDDKIDEIDENVFGAVNTLALRNCYCESKRMAEMLCFSWWMQKKIPIKIARIAHTYGPTMNIENDTRVFSSFVADIINKRNIVLNSDGMSKRPFTYIADAVAGYFTILFEGAAGNAYNVCNAEEFITIKQLAETIVNIFPEMKLKVERCYDSVNIKNETVNDIMISNQKLKKLGWYCKYSTQLGFWRTIEAIRKETEA